MRTLFTLAFFGFCAAFAVHAQSGAKLDERSAKKLIDEYVAPATDAARRAAIVADLRKGSPLLCQKTLKAILTDEAKRPLALDVALELRVPGLFDTARKFVDGPDEEKIVRLGFTTGDKGAAEALFERWAKAEEDSASFGFVQTGFEAYAVPLHVITKFRDVLKDSKARDAWKAGAARIIKFQFGLDTEDAALILDSWQDYEAAYKRDAQAFSVTGVDLLANATCTINGAAQRVGPNYRLGKGGTLVVAADEEWQSGTYSVGVKVRVNEGDGAEVGIRSAQGVWAAALRGDEWVMRHGDKTESAVPATKGAWATFVFTLKDAPKEAGLPVRLSRLCNLTIDGKVILDYGTMNGKMLSLEIEADKSVVVVAAAEFKRQ